MLVWHTDFNLLAVIHPALCLNHTLELACSLVKLSMALHSSLFMLHVIVLQLQSRLGKSDVVSSFEQNCSVIGFGNCTFSVTYKSLMVQQEIKLQGLLPHLLMLVKNDFCSSSVVFISLEKTGGAFMRVVGTVPLTVSNVCFRFADLRSISDTGTYGISLT